MNSGFLLELNLYALIHAHLLIIDEVIYKLIIFINFTIRYEIHKQT